MSLIGNGLLAAKIGGKSVRRQQLCEFSIARQFKPLPNLLKRGFQPGNPRSSHNGIPK